MIIYSRTSAFRRANGNLAMELGAAQKRRMNPTSRAQARELSAVIPRCWRMLEH